MFNTAHCVAAFALSAQVFAVGQRVQYKTPRGLELRGDPNWRWGHVTCVEPLKVSQKPGGKGQVVWARTS